jgi:hypothetical protein
MAVIMVLFGNEFDADEGAEVGGCDVLGKLDEIRSAAAELLEDWLSVAEDGDPESLPIVDLKDGCYGVFHRWT